MFELPPRLLGDEQAQLVALRDYLVRLATSLEPALSAAAVVAVNEAAATPSGAVRSIAGAVSAEEKQRIAELRSLIVKTADTVQHEIDVLTTELGETYVAQSDFGTYMEQNSNVITATAQGFMEDYGYNARLQSIDNTLDVLTSMQGQIRRGWLPDPDSPGEKILGIAIAQNLSIVENGSVPGKDGRLYDQLDATQTLGIYTASGWQFWVGGVRIGWFNANDGMLHVPDIAVQNRIQLGAGWILSADGGFGLRKLEA